MGNRPNKTTIKAMKEADAMNTQDIWEGKTDWERVRNMTEEDIIANAKSDPDAQPLSQEELDLLDWDVTLSDGLEDEDWEGKGTELREKEVCSAIGLTLISGLCGWLAISAYVDGDGTGVLVSIACGLLVIVCAASIFFD